MTLLKNKISLRTGLISLELSGGCPILEMTFIWGLCFRRKVTFQQIVGSLFR